MRLIILLPIFIHSTTPSHNIIRGFANTNPSNYFVVTTPYFPPFFIGFLILLRSKPDTMYFEEHIGPKVPLILKKRRGKRLLSKFKNCQDQNERFFFLLKFG
jgi:hypothetical protein